MLRRTGLVSGLLLLALVLPSRSQPDRKSGRNFAKQAPAVGSKLPDVVAYTPDGKKIQTSDLKGQYTVLTFGCLT